MREERVQRRHVTVGGHFVWYHHQEGRLSHTLVSGNAISVLFIFGMGRRRGVCASEEDDDRSLKTDERGRATRVVRKGDNRNADSINSFLGRNDSLRAVRVFNII